MVIDESGSYKYIRSLESEEAVSAKVNSNKSDASSIYKPLDENDSASKKTIMLCENPEPNAEHAFIVIKVGDDEAQQIGFAASSIATLKYFRDITKTCRNADVNPNVVEKTINVLRDLIFFVHKVDETAEEADAVEYEGITVEEKQRLLKDFKVIELLTEILYYPFQRKIFELDGIHNEGFLRIFQHCYRLIKHIIKEYRPNEIYASQWLEHYMEQAMKANADNDIKAEATLIELIDNNKKILDDKINTDMIAKFVQMLKENKNEKFVNLLRALCVCDYEAVVANQTDMSKFIIEDRPTRDYLIYQNYRKNNGHVEIQIKEYTDTSDGWIALHTFKSVSKKQDDGEKYDYFLSMVYLLADLCLGRNYIAMDFLQTVFTYDICFQVIVDELTDYELKSAFARTINTLWLNRTPYQPLNVPQYLILWDEITPSKCSQIESTDSDASMFDDLKDYLKKYYAKLAKEGCNKIYEVERNKFTVILVELTYYIVNFGFYKDVEQLKELLKPLLILLNGMKDVMTSYEFEVFKKKLKSVKKPKKHLNLGTGDLEERNTQRYEENERTNIIMDLKNRICELIQIIMNIDDDLRLRQFLLEFKNEINNTRDHDVSEFSRSPDKKTLFGKKQNATVDYAQNALDWMKNLSERNCIDFNKLAPTNFGRILFDLCLYENDDLVQNSFKILSAAHSQRNRLVEMLENVHILEDTEKKRAVLAIEEDIKALWELAEKTEVWYEKKDPKSVDSAKKTINLIKRLGGYLVNDSLMLKGNPEPDAEIVNAKNQGHEVDEDDLLEEQGVDPEFQTILRNLKAHEPLMEILDYESKSNGDKTNETRIAVLKETCKMLAKFASNSKPNQALLMDHMSAFQIILTRYAASGVDELIEILFKDNRTLVRQIDEVHKFAKSFIRIITKLKPENPRSSKLLMSLEPFMKYKNNPIKSNQTAILSLLTLKENSSIFITLDPKKNTRDELLKDDIFRKLDSYNAAVSNSTGLVELPPELDYLSCLLEIMAVTCDGKNAITESKSQNAWPLT